ncbi:MAG: Fe-S cluster assembly ATPase SufC [Candidatus Yonathbacteria bacterium]|nr:Fe-S cluster assembly ATPase SufC [Candidatus Yonathbacteria bacterium]
MRSLSIKNLTVSREGKSIINDVSVGVRQGEIHLILGPNGSGKSTLLNAIMNYPRYKIEKGNIILDNKNITLLPTEEKARRGIFLSVQHLPTVGGVTMLSFLHHAYRLIKKNEVSILDFYKMIESKVKEFNLDEKLLKRSVNVGFSGGEKKQGELIQMLALEPSFALLDEIDSGVDIDSLHKVFAGIEKLRKEGTGFIIVTHLGTILEKINPDRVSIMKGGKIVKTGGREVAREVLERGFNN